MMAKKTVNTSIFAKMVGECNPIADALSRIHMEKCGIYVSELLGLAYEQFQVGLHHFRLDKYNL